MVEVWCGVYYRISVGTVGQLCKEQKAKIFTTRFSVLFVLFTSELEPGKCRLRVGRPRKRCSISDRNKIFLSPSQHPHRLWNLSGKAAWV